MSPDQPSIMFCWCVPPGRAYAMPAETPLCSWPDCPNGHRSDPANHDPKRLPDAR